MSGEEVVFMLIWCAVD